MCKTILIIWCDNMSAGSLALNPVYHARTKHIEIDAHFMREKVLAKQLEVRYVPSHDQVADCLTKSLSHNHFRYLRSKLGMVQRPLILSSLKGSVGAVKDKYQEQTAGCSPL